MTLQSNDNTWVQVAEVYGNFHAEVIAGLLRTNDIPTYIESRSGMPSVLGHMGDLQRVYVPEKYFDIALDLLEDNDDQLSIDEPGIQL